MKLRNVPTRVTVGAFVLRSGLSKLRGDAETAQSMHGMATAAVPQLRTVDPTTFLRLAAAGEVATGAVLLAPNVPNRIAGLALTVFSGGLMLLYARTPWMREPGSIWPSQQGIGIAKDVWMLGIGLGLILDPEDEGAQSLRSRT